jgi:hypothetical protein
VHSDLPVMTSSLVARVVSGSGTRWCRHRGRICQEARQGLGSGVQAGGSAGGQCGAASHTLVLPLLPIQRCLQHSPSRQEITGQ